MIPKLVLGCHYYFPFEEGYFPNNSRERFLLLRRLCLMTVKVFVTVSEELERIWILNPGKENPYETWKLEDLSVEIY